MVVSQIGSKDVEFLPTKIRKEKKIFMPKIVCFLYLFVRF